MAGDPAKWHALVPVAFEMAATAKRHLNTAQSQWNQLESRQRDQAFAPLMAAIPCERFLARLARTNFVLDQAVATPDGLLPLACWWRNLRRTLF